MHFNRVTLAFHGAHKHLEPVFQQHFFDATLRQIRIAIVAGIIFYGGFGVLDRLIMPDRYHQFWFIRWAIVCPTLLWLYLFSFSRHAGQYLQLGLNVVMLVCGLGLISMDQLAGPTSSHSYAGGIVQLIFYAFTFCRLRFIWCSTVVLILVPAYLIVTAAMGSAPHNYVIGKAFHLSLIGIMGMMASYAIEYQTRKNFYLSRQLESKKRRLAIANEYLEERVARRTSELKETNAILKDEINERKLVEAALRDSQKRFQNIFETAAAGMAIIEGKTRTVVEINRAGAQMTRYKRSQVSGRRIEDLIVMPEDSGYRQIPVPTPHPIECLLVIDQGQALPILASSRNTVLNDQPHWILSFVNIQKIKEAEAVQRELEIRANRAQHLESIGTLAGGIAHDFNNILFGIMGFAELALEDAKRGSVQSKNLLEILRGGNRAKEMIAQILTFSRQDSMEKTVIQPAPLIKEALKLLRASLPSTIEIRSNFATELRKIKANATHLHQIVMNLCTNAAHAMADETGTIEISLFNRTIEKDRQTPHGTIAKGDYVQLTVRDDGHGISPDIVDRVFEPFYTTKKQGQGSGLGLSVVLGIVQSNQGSINIKSLSGEGTCFEVLIPATECEETGSEVVDEPLPTGNERILVVDDERHLLTLLNRILTSLGYHVTTCEHPAKALALFNSRPGHFDLVLTDLTMPKKSGTKLAQEMLQSRPNLPIILSTGFGNKISKEAVESIGIRELLFKPVLKRDLATTIRNALDTTQSNAA